jgi:hypothetical protein
VQEIGLPSQTQLRIKLPGAGFWCAEYAEQQGKAKIVFNRPFPAGADKTSVHSLLKPASSVSFPALRVAFRIKAKNDKYDWSRCNKSNPMGH